MSSMNMLTFAFNTALTFPIGLLLGFLSYILHRNAGKKGKRCFVLSTIWWWYLALLVYTILLSRESQPNSSVNFIPFKDLIHAIYFYYLEEIELILINFLLFVPMGYLLSVGLMSYPFYPAIPLFCFTMSLLIEVLQYFFKVGAFDINDIILNSMGGAWGWSLHKCFVWKKYRFFSLVAFAIPILVCFIIIGCIILQPYGKTAHDILPTRKISVKSVSFSSDFIACTNKFDAAIYKLSENNNQQQEIVENLFDALGSTISERILYDDCCVYYSKGRSFCVWYYYANGHFSLHNFKHNLSDYVDPSRLPDIYSFFASIGIDLPNGLELSSDNDSVIIKSNMLPFNKFTYDGSILFHITEEEIDTIEFQISELVYHSSAKTITIEGLQNRIAHGMFNYTKADCIEQIVCKRIDVEYALDSKNFYRPYFMINVVADGYDTALYIDALE